MEDLISRQQAIKAIEAVPDGNWRSIRYSQEIKKLPTIPQWIPCSERLPEYPFPCIVTFIAEYPESMGGEMSENEEIYWEVVGYAEGTWNNADGEPIDVEVIAWFEIPMPYIGVNHD